MWKDNNDQIMDILNNIETKDNKCFPTICPICGKREGHLYFHRNKKGNKQGGMWVWCSACYHSMHALYRIPNWWKNLEKVNIGKLTSVPDYLEENKICIDEWVSKLIQNYRNNKE